MQATVGSFKTEQIHRNGPWRDAAHVEVGALEWVDFFKPERPHEYLDDAADAGAPDPSKDPEFVKVVGTMPMSTLASFEKTSLDHHTLDLLVSRLPVTAPGE